MRINVEIDHHHPRQDGTCRIRLTIYEGKLVRHPLDIHVSVKNWDKARKRVRFGAPNFGPINAAIEYEYQRAERLAMERPGITPEQLREILKVPERSRSLLLSDALRDQYAEHEHRIKYGTRKGRRTILNDVERVLPTSTLAGLSVSEVMILDRTYVAAGLASNTRRSRLRRLRTMYRSACRLQGIDAKDLFAGIIPAPVRTIKQYLNPEQVDALRAAQLPTPHLQLAVDVWLLALDLGALRFNEVCRLRWDMLHDGQFRWIEGKVPKPRRHPVRDHARAILERYKGGVYVMPILADGMEPDAISRKIESANASLNKALRTACEIIGVPRVKMHNARHTGAQRIKNATGDVHAARMILGHSTVRQTEDYFNDFDEEAVNAVFDKIEGSSTGS